MHVVDTRTWQAREPVAVRAFGPTIQLEWLPDNRTVVSASGTTGRPCLFDVERAVVRTVPLPASADGGRDTPLCMPDTADVLSLVADDHTGPRYPLDPSIWLREACAVAGRDLTPRRVGPLPAGPALGAHLQRSRLRPPAAAPGRAAGAAAGCVGCRRASAVVRARGRSRARRTGCSRPDRRRGAARARRQVSAGWGSPSNGMAVGGCGGGDEAGGDERGEQGEDGGAAGAGCGT